MSLYGPLTPPQAASGDAFLGPGPDLEPLRSFIQARLTAAAEDILLEVGRTVARYLHRERRQQGGVVLKEEPLGVSEEFQQDLTWIKTCPEQPSTSDFHPAQTHSLNPTPEQTSDQPFPLYVIPVNENLAGDSEEEIQDNENSGSTVGLDQDPDRSLDLMDSEQLQELVDSEQLQGVMECKGCGRGFQKRLALLNHTEACHPEVCGLCGVTLGPSDVKEHLQVHREALFRCNVCGHLFTLKGNLVAHMKWIHSGLRPFRCNDCGKNFRRNRDLVRHKLDHTGERPYSCSVCGRGYRDKSVLKNHLRTHQKDNPLVSHDSPEPRPQ